MCLIIQKKKKQAIPYENIRLAWKQNDDGAGICYRTGTEVRIEKGFMSLDAFIKYLESNEKMLVKKELIIHLRFTTSGVTNQAMTHPFPVTKCNKELASLQITCKQAIIHNGVMFQPLTKGYSDTAIFTKWYQRTRPSDETILKVIGDDRLIIFDKDATKKLGTWIEIDGNSYSNTYSLTPRFEWDYKDNYNFNDIDSDVEGHCPICYSDDIAPIGLSKTSHAEKAYCYSCETVFDQLDLISYEEINAIYGFTSRRDKKVLEINENYNFNEGR